MNHWTAVQTRTINPAYKWVFNANWDHVIEGSPICGIFHQAGVTALGQTFPDIMDKEWL